jgi:hypothetical protein
MIQGLNSHTQSSYQRDANDPLIQTEQHLWIHVLLRESIDFPQLSYHYLAVVRGDRSQTESNVNQPLA